MRKCHLSGRCVSGSLAAWATCFLQAGLGVVERLEEVGVRRQGQSVFRGEYISSLPTSFPWSWKRRYPERSIKSILTEPGWRDETSPQLVCMGQQHKTDGALPTPMDLCAPSFSHTAVFTLKNSAPDPWSFESDACGDLVCSLPSVRSSSRTCGRNEAAKPARLSSPGSFP